MAYLKDYWIVNLSIYVFMKKSKIHDDLTLFVFDVGDLSLTSVAFAP